jgi:hypothetical protein
MASNGKPSAFSDLNASDEGHTTLSRNYTMHDCFKFLDQNPKPLQDATEERKK